MSPGVSIALAIAAVIIYLPPCVLGWCLLRELRRQRSEMDRHVAQLEAEWRGERHELLNRIQAPDPQGYGSLLSAQAQHRVRTSPAEAGLPGPGPIPGQPFQPGYNDMQAILAGRPWLDDPEYVGQHVVVDAEQGVVWVTDDDLQETRDMPMGPFLSRYLARPVE